MEPSQRASSWNKSQSAGFVLWELTEPTGAIPLGGIYKNPGTPELENTGVGL